MKTQRLALYMILYTVAVVVLGGCEGKRTFHEFVRAGDTVAVAAGWKHNMQRGNIEVTITDSMGTITTYTPGQPGYEAVKASINLYPDPVSSIVLSDMTQQNVTQGSEQYAYLVNYESTNYDRDWWETVVFVDLPDPMALGDATIDVVDIVSPAMESVSSTVTVVPDETGTGTGGSPNTYQAQVGSTQFGLYDIHMQALERHEHFVVTFTGATVPHAIQVDLTHDADEAHGGAGVPFVVNPIGHIKSVSWAPTGTSGTDLRVIMTPAAEANGVFTMNDFKFYVAGGVQNVDVVDQDTGDPDLDVLAYDENGNLLTGADEVVATVTFMN